MPSNIILLQPNLILRGELRTPPRCKWGKEEPVSERSARTWCLKGSGSCLYYLVGYIHKHPRAFLDNTSLLRLFLEASQELSFLVTRTAIQLATFYLPNFNIEHCFAFLTFPLFSLLTAVAPELISASSLRTERSMHGDRAPHSPSPITS